MPVAGTVPHKVVVASWNLHEGVPASSDAGPCSLRTLDEVACLLTDRRVDIAAFQEVGFDGTGTSELLEHVRNVTALRHVTAFPLHASSFFPGRLGGVALASRFPWHDHSRFVLPNPDLTTHLEEKEIRSHDKGLVSATCSPWGIELGVTSLHSFPFHLFRREAQEADFKEIWDSLTDELRRQLDRHPVLVCGDFNTGDRRLVLDGEDMPLTSAIEGRATYKEESVDDILYSPSIELLRTEILANFSDHSMCLSEFRLNVDSR